VNGTGLTGANDGEVAEAGYFAFISYSHRDSGRARRIHRALETYRVPAKLRGTPTALGTVPEKLYPIFRDREELSAGDDLSRQVQDALEASRALIVLCSPAAKASAWVNKEIQSFRELHPDRPIIAALIAGEPDEAFPPALTQGSLTEPVAADFRKSGDGWRLGLMKLVAGLTGLALNDLVQRESQRQLRRVTVITLGSLAAVLVMGLLLISALRAQAEAERQRAEAEGLVEFMLGDLRDRLRGVGRLDVMSAVNERAMAYYGQQDALDRLPDASLDRRARILHAMGEDDEKRGDQEKALAKFLEAHRTTAAVLGKNPANAEAIFAHAQSEYWVGSAAWKKKDRATTTRFWQGYLKQAEQLAKLEPGKARSAIELGYSSGNLCAINVHKNFDLSAADRWCSRSTAHVRDAIAADPGNVTYRQTLANRHGWSATVYINMQRFRDAIAAREKELTILDGLLAQDPGNYDLKKRQTWAMIGMAIAHAHLRDALATQQWKQRALAALEQLRTTDPSDTENASLIKRTNAIMAAGGGDKNVSR
jgi:tetratricopeptide (TPR) repeat protein